jgi:hypothetical protein
MKKILIAISGLLLVALIVIRVANAQTFPQEVKKAATEKKMDCGKCPSASKTCHMKTCDPAKCKEAKCDTVKCNAACPSMKSGMKNCDPSKCNGMTKK